MSRNSVCFSHQKCGQCYSLLLSQALDLSLS